MLRKDGGMVSNERRQENIYKNENEAGLTRWRGKLVVAEKRERELRGALGLGLSAWDLLATMMMGNVRLLMEITLRHHTLVIIRFQSRSVIKIRLFWGMHFVWIEFQGVDVQMTTC